MYSIGLEKDFIFIHIPKSGGGAIKDHLLKHIPNENLFYPKEGYHSRLMDYADAITNNPLCKPLSEYFIFTVLRNPFERMVSLYEWKRKGTPDSDFDEVTKDAQTPLGGKHVQRPSEINRIPPDASFSQFLFNLDKCTEPKETYEYLYWQECHTPSTGQLHFATYQNLQAEYDLICDHLGLKKEKLLKIHKTDRKPVSEYYTSQFLCGIVYGLFMREIRQFEWEPPWEKETT